MLRLVICLLLAPVFAISQHLISLNKGWVFSQADKNEWRSAQVPGSAQQDLIRHKTLPDPYYGSNEQDVQWVEQNDWDYKKTFSISAEQLLHEDAILHFEGIDTYADVFLNGAHILSAQNMFVGHAISVKKILKAGDNKMYIRFRSPSRYLELARQTNGFEYPAGNDHSDKKVSIYARKAPYHFGWDWGMRLVQMGIWRPVYLAFHNKVRIDDYYIKQHAVSKQAASTDHSLEVFSYTEGVNATLAITYAVGKDKPETIRHEVLLKKGLNTLNFPIHIKNPKLWMPRGWGEAHLYTCSVSIAIEGKVLAEKTHQVGLRTIELVNKPDEHGRSFFFKVNGIPLFAKGANYIPGEIMTSRQDKAYYDRLFNNVTAAHMNMIRVWGGGVYEDDYFYKLADEKGILVWQDLMFACSPYPHDKAFLSNVEREIDYNLKRLRNHASIALWCGNNEAFEAINYWDLDKEYSPEVMANFRNGYDSLFRQLLPDLLKKLDPDRYYLHTSPETSAWGKPESLKYGDSHYWGIWHGREPFEKFSERVPRFMAEYGFQAFPEMKTIRTFASEADLDIDSEVMKTHQKSGIGNKVINQYMEKYYHVPKKFEDFVYVGLVMQGEGMKLGIETHRRSQPYCMGTIYWQLNDSWPVVSWSGIDYYNNWKALHYKARDAFAPVTVNVHKHKDSLQFFTISDKLSDVNDLTMNIRVIDFFGKVSKKTSEKLSIKANASKLSKSMPIAQLVDEKQLKNSLVNVRLVDKSNKVVAETNYYFDVPKHLDLPETAIKTTVKQNEGSYVVTLSSKALAKNVFIEVPAMGAQFTDNFFDLLPGETKTVVITAPELKKAVKTPIKVKHLRQTY